MMFFVVSKKSIIIACASLFLGILTGSFLLSNSHAGMSRANDGLTVLIDAGHGLPDGGAVGINGTVEQEINLQIAKKLAEVLEAKNINVIMTRQDENSLSTDKSSTIRAKKIEDMHNRLAIMKKSNADVFISIHMNSFSQSSASGLHIFYDIKHEDIKPLAEAIQSRMADVTGAKMHIVKVIDRNLYLMKNPPLPSILIECGFLSNPNEEKKLCQNDYQSRIGWAIADAIEKYYALDFYQKQH